MKLTIALIAGLTVGVLPAASAGGAAASPVAAGASLPSLTLTMTGHSIRVAGGLRSGAVTVISRVSGKSDGSPTLVKLKPGVSYAKAIRASAQDPNGIIPYATITYNTDAPKGTSTAQTLLSPGRWVAVDTAKTDPSKWPHVSFTVRRAAHPARLPKAGGTVAMRDFFFTGPSVWHDGETVRFVNQGYVTHMVVAAKVANKSEAAIVSQLLLAGDDNQAQQHTIGFATFMGIASPGGLQQQRITASPGTYVLACFMDTQDHREHTRLGMERTITITG